MSAAALGPISAIFDVRLLNLVFRNPELPRKMTDRSDRTSVPLSEFTQDCPTGCVLRDGSIPLRFQGGVAAPLIKKDPVPCGADGVVVKRSRSLLIDIRVAH